MSERKKMHNRYAILAAGESVESYLSLDSSSCNKRRPALKPVNDAKRKVNRNQDKHRFRVMHDGQVIDEEVVKKYLKQVEESEGFDITDYPGPIEECTLAPYCILDYRDKEPEYYDSIMDLSALAIKKYNREHPKTNFKVAEIEKLNVGNFFTMHYITFSAVDVKGSWRDSFFVQFVNTALVIMMTLLTWLLIFWPPRSRPRKTLEEKLMKLKSAPYRASEEELCDGTAARKTFQAVVEYLFSVTDRTALSCRVAKKKKSVVNT